jgi:succinate dehydrogenase / fumarate reductase flavoprotein subunit
MFDYVPECSASRVRDDRGGGRPLVHRPGQQPAPAGAAAARRGGPGDQLRGEGRPRQRRTAGCSWTSPPAERGVHPTAAAVACTTSSRSWPTSTSPRSRWRSAPPATT